MLPLAWPRLWQAGAVLLVLGIVVGSLLPGPVVETVSHWDKLDHALGYGAVTLWLAGMLRPARYLHAALAAFLLGVALEATQALLTASRQGDLLDVVANTSGIGVALVLAHLGLGGWAARAERWLGASPRA